MDIEEQLYRRFGKEAIPVGTCFAISDSHICAVVGNSYLPEIGIAEKYINPMQIDDITVLSYVAHCFDSNEDWAIYSRKTGLPTLSLSAQTRNYRIKMKKLE